MLEHNKKNDMLILLYNLSLCHSIECLILSITIQIIEIFLRKDLQNSCLKGGHMYSFYMILKMYITSQSNTLESLRLFGCYKG